MNPSPIQLDYHGRRVRMVGTPERPEWVAADVCAVLGIGNPRQVLSRFDEDEKGVTISDTPGGVQKLATVTEPGVYRLIVRSRKAEAVAFRRWLFHEVLPSIRAHGCYPPPPQGEPGLFGPIEPSGRAGGRRVIVATRPPQTIGEAIDPADDLIPLPDVRDLPWLPTRPGKRTPYEWHRHGRRGIFLETIRGAGGRLFTTPAAVLRFLWRTAQPQPAEDAPPHVTTIASAPGGLLGTAHVQQQ
jgi:hypothetical protein